MKKALVVWLCALVIAATGLPGVAAPQAEELFIYIWSEYLPDEIVAEFSQETGIKVTVSTYDSNEAMYAKIKLVGAGYDLIVPSADYVGLMREQGLLLPVDRTALKNFSHLAPRFVDQPFDPGNGYSVPYMWGSTAIAVNTAVIGAETVQSLEDLWKPELDGRLLLPNDPREVIGFALKSLGYSLNDTDAAHVAQAYEKLATLVPRVRVFDSDSPKQALLAGEVGVAVMWNGEAYIAAGESEAVKYIYPPEGFSLWLDSFCIPKGAKNIEAAHRFLDFILRPDIAARISTDMGYSTPNAKALELLEPEVRYNPIVYPPEVVLERGEFLENLNDDVLQIYNDYWVKLKTD